MIFKSTHMYDGHAADVVSGFSKGGVEFACPVSEHLKESIRANACSIYCRGPHIGQVILNSCQPPLEN